MSDARRRGLRVGSVTLLLWCVGLGWWATSTLTDNVPTGEVDGRATSVEVECARPIDSETNGADALPVLEPPRQFEREPCIPQHRENRVLLFANAVLALILVAGLGAARWRDSKSRQGGVQIVD